MEQSSSFNCRQEEGTSELSLQQRNLIDLTRQKVSKMQDSQRFLAAENHVWNALRYREPRFDICSSQWKWYKFIYELQRSEAWEIFMVILSFAYMYLIVIEQKAGYKYADPCILFFLILDFVMEKYHESFDDNRQNSRYSKFFWGKLSILMFLALDCILLEVGVIVNQRQFHPFRVLRSALPILYSRQINRSFESLASAYKDILVYFVFYFTVVFSFALVGSQLIVVNTDLQLDPYRNDYNNIGHMFFIMYINGTYDTYPDNQMPAIKSCVWYYAFFILFIILNMFMFSSIPGSLIFETYRETRSKLILLDEIKMQNSLIVAFVSLGEEDYQISLSRMVSFLHYLYGYRVRFVDVVTDICLKMNPNDHTSIHINDFMQLGRIFQQNANLRPPLMKDSKNWIRFREWVNRKIFIKDIVLSIWFNVLCSIFVLFGFVNALILFYDGQPSICSLLDNTLANIFTLQLILKIVGIGPEAFLNQEFSALDFTIIFLGFIFQFVDSLTNQDALLRMVRVFRAFYLVNIIGKKCGLEMVVYKKARNLFSRTTVILPLIAKFLPIFLIVYYILGVLGMEILFEAYQLPAIQEYSTYNQFSSFRQFIQTQFYLVQVLTEAGWSSVALDISARQQKNFTWVMTFFCVCHIVIVLILATLLKGIIWSTFLTVNQQYQEKKREWVSEGEKQRKGTAKLTELQMLTEVIDRMDYLNLDTILKRQIYEWRVNEQILKKIAVVNRTKKITRRSIKSVGEQGLYRNFNVNRYILQDEEEEKRKTENAETYIFEIIQKFTRERFKPQNIVIQLQRQDFEERIHKLCKRIKMKGQPKYEVKNSSLFLAHLNMKLQTPCAKVSHCEIAPAPPGSLSLGVNSPRESVSARESVTLHIFDMHLLLGMQASWREQKALVIGGLVQGGAIEGEGRDLLYRRITEDNFAIDENSTIRRMYLQGTEKGLIEKFQAEYFADLYGNAFKEINKVTIEPLIHLESTVVYALKNILRYPQIGTEQFFKILSQIQNMISNELLKRGSLCKFVFQVNCEKDIWFCVSWDAMGVRLNFIKNGCWINHPELIEGEIYYARDLFKLQRQLGGDLVERADLVKSLYQTFESMALTIRDKEHFFESNANFNVYDTYFMYSDVNAIERLIAREVEVSKIMVVLLTKEEQRTQQIPFDVSDILLDRPTETTGFQLDETEKQTFQKLSRLADLNDAQVTAREGLPFSYVLNFLTEINDILKLYSPNFLHQVQNILNDKFKKEAVELSKQK